MTRLSVRRAVNATPSAPDAWELNLSFRLVTCHSQSTYQKLGHEIQCLFRLRQVVIIPKRVPQCFEHDKLRADSSPQEGAMQDGCPAQQQVTTTGHEERGRKSAQVGIERREHRALGISASDVLSASALIVRGTGINRVRCAMPSASTAQVFAIAAGAFCCPLAPPS
jgi:hypothetical protein